MKLQVLLLAITLTASLIGCTQEPPEPQLNDTDWSQNDVNTLVQANNRFAFDLYSKYKEDEGNLFFSPYSISTALAMTYEGARGQTAKEMREVFYYPENSSLMRSSFSKIHNDMNRENNEYELSTANALWAEQEYKFLDEYFQTVENYYGGKVTNMDFRNKPEEARVTINNWVEEKTKEKIKDLIPQGAIDPMTRLVLTNAIYFKGTWVLEFDEELTKKEDFQTPSGTVQADMMRNTGEKAEFNYAETNSLQILEMPYEGENVSMLILLPKGDINSLEESLTTKKLEEWKKSLEEQRVKVYLPKFETETKYFMAKDLEEMGMPSAFGGGADFSGMDGTKLLYISEVIHQAYVKVDEEGTEAAAATAVIMKEMAAPGPRPEIPVFRADHPFIFIIQQKDTGNILFMGKINDPTK